MRGDTVGAQCCELLGEERAADVHDRTVVIEAWEVLNREHVSTTFQEMCELNTSLERFDWGLNWYTHNLTVTVWKCVAYRGMVQPASVEFMWRLAPSRTVRPVSTAVGILCREQIDM